MKALISIQMIQMIKDKVIDKVKDLGRRSRKIRRLEAKFRRRSYDDEITEWDPNPIKRNKDGVIITDDLSRLDEIGSEQDWSQYYKTYAGGSIRYGSFCTHKPALLIQGKGWSLSAASKGEALACLSEYDVVLNCSGISINVRHKHKLPDELKPFVESQPRSKPLEILLDWDDYADINLKPEFWEALTTYLHQHQSKALVFCQGGHGRTGTALACMLIAACDYTAKKALKWVRRKYCPKAIESITQETYIKKVYTILNSKPEVNKQ